MAANRGGNWENRLSHISPESNRTMPAMNPRMHRRPNKTFQALAASVLAWAGPAHCAPTCQGMVVLFPGKRMIHYSLAASDDGSSGWWGDVRMIVLREPTATNLSL